MGGNNTGGLHVRWMLFQEDPATGEWSLLPPEFGTKPEARDMARELAGDGRRGRVALVATCDMFPAPWARARTSGVNLDLVRAVQRARKMLLAFGVPGETPAVQEMEAVVYAALRANECGAPVRAAGGGGR